MTFHIFGKTHLSSSFHNCDSSSSYFLAVSLALKICFMAWSLYYISLEIGLGS